MNHRKSRNIVTVLGVCAALLFGSGFTYADDDPTMRIGDDLDISSFHNYQREYLSESIGACSTSSTKTYESYELITHTESDQYKYIHEHMTIDSKTGLLYNEDGFIGAALGFSFGDIGSEYYFILDSGVILPIVKVDSKGGAVNGCSMTSDSSVIEFVIDTDIAMNYFGSTNGYASNGNFNNCIDLAGSIVDVEKVSDEKLEDGVIYEEHVQDTFFALDLAQIGVPSVEETFLMNNH